MAGRGTRGRTAPPPSRSQVERVGARPRPPASPSARGSRASPSTAPAVALHEHRARGSARQRLDPERARSGEQVEHAQALDVAEDREERLADAVGGRADVSRAAAAPRSRLSAVSGPAHAPSRRDRLAAPAEQRRGRVAQQRVLRRVESGSRASSSVGPARARLEQAASSGSRATRNSGRPCWRVPSTSPAPRRSRSISASSKPSPLAGERLEPRQRRIAEQDAQPRVLAAADPPAQLVQLRDAVALGRLDHHHRRVRHVDADLDHARRHEHVGLARGERPIASAFCADGIWPWISATRWSRNSVRASRSASRGRGRRLERLRLLRRAGRRRTPGGPAAISSRARS